MCLVIIKGYKFMTKSFFVFDKHKNNIVVLLTLGKSKKDRFLLTLGKPLTYP